MTEREEYQIRHFGVARNLIKIRKKTGNWKQFCVELLLITLNQKKKIIIIIWKYLFLYKHSVNIKKQEEKSEKNRK